MKLHKEGTTTIVTAAIIFVAINILNYKFVSGTLAKEIILVVTGAFLLFLTSFFRSPRRKATRYDGAIVAPADGTVVVIEETDEPEVLKTRCLQVSIFMSVTNVHINWYPVSGVVKFCKHHNGKFQAAWLPKSSTENERSSILIERPNGQQILIRQVAGALARRIVTYAEEGKKVRQSDQMGFIKFGSRVDMYLPLGTKIDATMKQSVVGSQTIIGWLN
ncbi:MAG: phosphatidylserine decarboxylase family protein [Marinilabiliaceae bacterium]|nr:phosphatidylserine decarboxylase family protein [Marinilabiliaceae bacterium]